MLMFKLKYLKVKLFHNLVIAHKKKGTVFPNSKCLQTAKNCANLINFVAL